MLTEICNAIISLLGSADSTVSDDARQYYCYCMTSLLLILDCLLTQGVFKRNSNVEVCSSLCGDG